MSITERSHNRTNKLIDRLNNEYESFEIVEQTWNITPTQYTNVQRRFEQGSAGGAGVWLTNEDGEVLLVRNEGDDGWGDPGGKVEPGETFEVGAKRELREETNAECRLLGVCEVHVINHKDEENLDEPSILAPIVIFFGEYTNGEIRPREGEIADVEWFSEPPENVLYNEVRTRSFGENPPGNRSIVSDSD